MAVNLTAREQELLYAVAITNTSIDWKEVAEKGNFNTAKQARDKWISVRNKVLAGMGGNGDGEGAATPATNGKANGGSKKRKAADETPSKKSKKAKKPTTPVDEGDAEDGARV